MGARGLVDAVLFNVADDADDFAPSVGTVGDVDPLSDRIFVGKMLAGHGLVDDRDPGRLRIILPSKDAAADQPDAHRPEIVGVTA